MGLITRLLILWLLSEGPLHGYRIRKILGAEALAFWFQVDEASIYSMLRSLQKQGFARSDGEEQDGKRPHRRVYRITRTGRQELARCQGKAWHWPALGRDPFCAALATADEFEANEIRGLLHSRGERLRARRAGLARLARGAPSPLLARREAALLEAEITWIDRELGASERKGGMP